MITAGWGKVGDCTLAWPATGGERRGQKRRNGSIATATNSRLMYVIE